MALIVALFASVLLAGMGLSLALLGSAETMLAGHDGQAAAAAQAARGGIALAESQLRAMADWSGVVTAGSPTDVCAVPGPFTDVSLQPRGWDGAVIDLHAQTLRLQADSDAATPAGLAAPVWRLFAYGPISRLTPPGAPPAPFYLAAWVADGRDGVLLLHAAAFGPAGLLTAVEASVARRPGGTSLDRLALRRSR